MQKTSSQGNGCPRGARTESGSYYEGVQTYIWMTEDNVVEVPFDKEHLLEVILSPKNLNDAYKCVVRNKGCGGVDKMSCEQLLPWLSANKEKTIVYLQRYIFSMIKRQSSALFRGFNQPKSTFFRGFVKFQISFSMI